MTPIPSSRHRLYTDNHLSIVIQGHVPWSPIWMTYYQWQFSLTSPMKKTEQGREYSVVYGILRRCFSFWSGPFQEDCCGESWTPFLDNGGSFQSLSWGISRGGWGRSCLQDPSPLSCYFEISCGNPSCCRWHQDYNYYHKTWKGETKEETISKHPQIKGSV